MKRNNIVEPNGIRGRESASEAAEQQQGFTTQTLRQDTLAKVEDPIHQLVPLLNRKKQPS